MGTTQHKYIRITKGPHKGKEMKADREINFHWAEDDLPPGKNRRYIYVVENPDIQFLNDDYVKEI